VFLPFSILTLEQAQATNISLSALEIAMLKTNDVFILRGMSFFAKQSFKVQ
jgi:hypothetical protein